MDKKEIKEITKLFRRIRDGTGLRECPGCDWLQPANSSQCNVCGTRIADLQQQEALDKLRSDESGACGVLGRLRR